MSAKHPRSSKAKAAPASSAPRRSPCPVACGLDLFGDKWTLLLLRDLMWGKKRFGEFLESPEGIPTNLLADRLQRLVQAEIICAEPYQTNPVRHEYRLTAAGRELLPILGEMAKWGLRHIPGTITLDRLRAESQGKKK